MNKERTISGIKVFVSGETYDEYKGTLQEQLEEKEKEIEKLNNDLGDAIKLFAKEREQTKRLNNIIKEVREYIESYNLPEDLGVSGEAPISIRELRDILEILDKESK